MSRDSAPIASVLPRSPFWAGKRVLLTGHSGFKGAWLGLWLHRLGARVTGVSLPPATDPSLAELARVSELLEGHVCDIRDADALTRVVRACDPEIVLHLAAQPLVRRGYREPVVTFETNVMGTVHLLEALRGCQAPRVVLVVTTDKVYQNDSSVYPFRETDALGGHDPYSASKAATELVVASYRGSFLAQNGVALASARAGNVIGGGDWAEERLIPDAIRAWGPGGDLHVRQPDAVRPWQHVLEPLAGYLVLAERLWDEAGLAGAFNFGPRTEEAARVRRVIEIAHAAFGRGSVSWRGGEDGLHEAPWLSLEVAKSRSLLGFHPRWGLEESIMRTMRWYQRQQAGLDARELCLSDIEDYTA